MAIQQIVTPWDQQPQEAVEIDWANPLAAHARALITCRLEHVSGSLATSVAGSPPDLAPGAAGLGLKFGGSSAVEFPGAKYVPPPLTVCFVANKSSSASDTLISFGGAASGAGWQIQTAGVNVDGRITYGGVADYSPIGALFSVGVDAVYHVTVSANTARFYRNGAFIGSCAVGTPNTPTKPLTLGASWSGSGYVNFSSSTIYGAQVFSRVLSDQEVAEHASNVWRLFQRREFAVPIQQAAGGEAAQLSSSAAGSLVVSASLSVASALGAAASGSLAATAALTTAVRLSAVSSGSLAATAALTTVSSGLSGAASGSLAATAALTTAVRLNAAASGSLAAVAALTTAVRLTAVSSGSLASTAALTAVATLSSAATAGAQAAASLTTWVRLQSAAAVAFATAARLSVGVADNSPVTAYFVPSPLYAELSNTGAYADVSPWPITLELKQ